MNYLLKLIFLYGSTNICFAMQHHDFHIEKPFWNSTKYEYVIEACNNKNEKIGRVIFHMHPDSKNGQWVMRDLCVDQEYRQKGVARVLLHECIERIKKYHAKQLSWQVHPKQIGMSEEQLITIYYKMLEKIDPLHTKQTEVEYRGNSDYQIPFMILNLK